MNLRELDGKTVEFRIPYDDDLIAKGFGKFFVSQSGGVTTVKLELERATPQGAMSQYIPLSDAVLKKITKNPPNSKFEYSCFVA